MFSLLSEALTTALFPCSLVLAVPGLAVALGGRRLSAIAVATFVVGLIATSWLRFSGVIDVWPAIVTGALLLLAGVGLALPEGGTIYTRPALTRGIAGFLAGAAAGSLWRPCVGFEFGDILTNLDSSGAVGLLRHGLYVLGVMAPVIALTALANGLPPSWIERANRPLAWVGGGVLVVLGVATMVGLGDQVIDRLFQLSSF